MGAETSISNHLVEEWRPKTLGYICLSEGLLSGGDNLEKQVVSSKLNETVSAGPVRLGAYPTGSEPFPVAEAALATFARAGRFLSNARSHVHRSHGEIMVPSAANAAKESRQRYR